MIKIMGIKKDAVELRRKQNLIIIIFWMYINKFNFIYIRYN